MQTYQLSKNPSENPGAESEKQKHEKELEIKGCNAERREMALKGRAVHEAPCIQSEQKTDDHTHPSSGDGCNQNNQKVAAGIDELVPSPNSFPKTPGGKTRPIYRVWRSEAQPSTKSNDGTSHTQLTQRKSRHTRLP